MSSRKEVGEILLASGVPTAVLNAAIVIGSGSASFEMLRYLTERLPVMITRRWERNRVQPIAVRDVLHYLIRAVQLPAQVSRVICRHRDIAEHIPDPPDGLTNIERAIELPLTRIREADVPTRWSDASAPSDHQPTDPDWSGGSRYTDIRDLHTDTCPEKLWRVIEAIGGEHGWYPFAAAARRRA
ncbi:hypothetical protein [Amycolatopsis taiwanensis]|uniref:Uncharacterized protein n=1 Tax=Amycolatopsis taiwanensis TaxID=342230 RepID=A0A9W6QWB0_9PSEU|nr:hypothetical protein Atai01_13730 [Amycolatopsis taiwanensis]